MTRKNTDFLPIYFIFLKEADVNEGLTKLVFESKISWIHIL